MLWYKIKQQQNETGGNTPKIHMNYILALVSLKSQSTLLDFFVCLLYSMISNRSFSFFLNHNSLLPFFSWIYVDNLIILFFLQFCCTLFDRAYFLTSSSVKQPLLDCVWSSIRSNVGKSSLAHAVNNSSSPQASADLCFLYRNSSDRLVNVSWKSWTW